MSFANGCLGTLTYSGYAHCDSNVWMDGVGELGHRLDGSRYGEARRRLQRVSDTLSESDLKAERVYGSTEASKASDHFEHFGPTIVLCQRGDIRLTPSGVWVYKDLEREFRQAAPMRVPRTEVIDALVGAVRHGRAPPQTARWGLATLEACHAILRSAATGEPVDLVEQISVEGQRAA